MHKSTSLILLSLILTGCGGSDDSSETEVKTPTNRVPTLSSSTIETLNGDSSELDLSSLAADADGDTLTISSLGTPSHGSVSMSGMNITYNPDDDYAGTDSFTVTVSDGTDSTTSTMNVMAYQGLTLKGKVVDEPVPGAIVTILLNGETFTTTADENGNYTIAVKTTDTTQFITVMATGDATSTSGIKLVNMLGETSSLLDSASDTRVLGENPEDATNVTNITSARYILAKEANGGEEITSDGQLTQLEKSIDATQLIEIAAVIKVILDNPDYALPDGFTDVLEFVSNSEAYNTFVDQVTAENPDDNALTQAITAISQDPDLAQGFTSNTLASSYILATATAPGFLSKGGDLMELKANAKGAFTNSYGQKTFNWTLADGTLTLTFDSPVKEYGFYDVYSVLTKEQADQYVKEYGVWQVGGTKSIKGQSYSRLVDGNQIDTVSVSSTYDVAYDDIYLNGIKVDLAMIVDEHYTEQQLMRDGDAAIPLPIVDADMLESWAVPTLYESSYGLTYNGDLLEFSADGTGNAVLSNRTFTWSLANNTVTVTFSDKTKLIAQKLDGIGELSALSLKTFDENGSQIAFSYEFSTWHDDINSNLNASNLVSSENHFWTTFVNGWMARYWKNGVFDYVAGSGFGFDFNADGTVETINYFYDSENPNELLKTVVPGTWEIGTEEDSKVLSFTRCFQVDNCQRREWLGLQVTSNQLIVLERSINPDGTIGIPPRLNIYRDWEKLAENTSTSASPRKPIQKSSKRPTKM
ncbi:Ig-like domain-containing protein [Shewanella sp. A25]|nr:Ig-like domain-containing protein [Shewanella shenzhenensis]